MSRRLFVIVFWASLSVAAAIVQSDVEIYTDETGKPHVASLVH